MKQELKDKLIVAAHNAGYTNVEDAELYEFVKEHGKEIEERDFDEHRWYSTYVQVKKISDFYVSFVSYQWHGDECPMDHSEIKDTFFDSISEVVPKEVTTIEYVEV